jgi:hypothetical protein
MNRRRLLRMAGGSVAAGAIGMLGEKSAALAQTYSKGITSMTRGDHGDPQEAPSWRSFARC